MEWSDHIHSDPEILAGKPIIKGTRLSVLFILARLADGWSEEELLENYPALNREKLQAIHTFALDMLKDSIFHFPGSDKRAA